MAAGPGADDPYVIEQLLARGPSGTTELVTLNGRGPFVRKRMPLEHADADVWRALAAARIARVPRVLEVYEADGCLCVVLEYVEGPTADGAASPSRPMGEALAAGVVRQVCEAASGLHELGIVHRDIKPGNVVLAADGAHLIDLGAARVVHEGAARDTTLLGTVAYAAPEQFGYAQSDARSDVFSIGRLLGFLLTGADPGNGDFAGRLYDDAYVPPAMRSVIEKACSLEPSARYQSAEELSGAVADAASVARVPAVGRRRRGVVALVATALTAAVVVGVVVSMGDAATATDDAVTEATAEASAGSATTTADGTTTDGTTADGTSGSSGTSSLFTQLGEAAAASAARERQRGASANAEASEGLRIVDSGWAVEGGTGEVYVYCSLYNPNQDVASHEPRVTAVGRDASGNILFTKKMGAFFLLPGETSYHQDSASVTDGELASVDFSIDEPQYWCWESLSGGLATVEEFNVVASDYGVEVLGTVSVGEGYASLAEGVGPASYVSVIAIARDAQGQVVWTAADTVTNPGAGGSTTFDAAVFSSSEAYLRSYETVEVHAHL